MSAVEKFPILLSEAEEESSAVPPCFSDEGINVLLPFSLSSSIPSSPSSIPLPLPPSSLPIPPTSQARLGVTRHQLTIDWQYLYIRHSNLYLLALTKRNTNATEILLFLHKIVEVFTEYFKELEEESIRDNFVVIYELLDEMMDFGYPQTTETKILQEYASFPTPLPLITLSPPPRVRISE